MQKITSVFRFLWGAIKQGIAVELVFIIGIAIVVIISLVVNNASTPSEFSSVTLLQNIMNRSNVEVNTTYESESLSISGTTLILPDNSLQSLAEIRTLVTVNEVESNVNSEVLVRDGLVYTKVTGITPIAGDVELPQNPLTDIWVESADLAERPVVQELDTFLLPIGQYTEAQQAVVLERADQLYEFTQTNETDTEWWLTARLSSSALRDLYDALGLEQFELDALFAADQQLDIELIVAKKDHVLRSWSYTRPGLEAIPGSATANLDVSLRLSGINSTIEAPSETISTAEAKQLLEQANQ